MKIFRCCLLSAFLTLGALAVIISASGCSKSDKQALPPEYAVMTLDTSSITMKNSFPATIRGCQDIEIRSNVDGFIVKVCVDEGDMVKKGEVLFEVDHSIYEADYNMALANLKAAEANVKTARLTAENKTLLASKGVISDYEKRLADNDLNTKIAEENQAKAKLKSAKTNLDFSYIKSPSNGIVGTIAYRVGSLVGPSKSEAITSVSQIEKMFVYFSMNEKQILSYARQGGSNTILDNMPEVELKLADGTIYPHKGKVETISGLLDLSTGAANMRAGFKNPERLLRSGGTGSVLIPSKNDAAILIPQSATYEMQDKKFVCMLNDSNIVKAQEIKVAALDNGEQYVVNDGLKRGDRIVVEGVGISVKDGMKITPITVEEAAAKLNAATSVKK